MADDIIIWDDGANFWSSLFAMLSDEISVKKHGASSLKIVTSASVDMYHYYQTGLEDLSVNDDISFWFKGCNSGAEWEIDFYNMDYSENSATWVDNSSGWKLVSIPRSSFTPTLGSPTWNNIFLIDIYNNDTFAGTVYFDYLVNGTGIIPTPADVTIGAFSPDFILSFSKTVANTVMIPEWLNQPAIIDTNVYNREVTKLEYTFRASDIDKYTADKILLAHSKVNLIDYINQITGDVWMTNIQARYTPLNFDRPWEVTVTLISDNLIGTGKNIIFSSQQINCGGCAQPPCTTNQGSIIVDGETYSLPVIIKLSVGNHTIEYDPTVEFSDWVVSGANSVSGSEDPATLTIVEDGTVVAEYFDYLVVLSTNIDNPCDYASITIGGVVYTTPSDFYEVYGDYDVLIDGHPTGQYANSYAFDHWITSGGVSVDDIHSVTTVMHITGDGTLQGYYHPISLVFDSHHLTDGGDLHKGEIEHQWYPPPPPYDGYPEYPLPKTWSPTNVPDYFYIKWNPLSSGKVFDHWIVTGGVTVDNANSQTTICHIANDSGTLTAVYKNA